jgi:hypothetical protein
MTDVVSFVLGYPFIGCVLWMLLIDEVRSVTRQGFLIGSLIIILDWPVMLVVLALKVVGR